MTTGNDLFYCRVRVVTRQEIQAEIEGPTLQKTPMQIAMQAMIDSYLSRGWVITKNDPLTLYRGRAGYQLQNGVLVSL